MNKDSVDTEGAHLEGKGIFLREGNLRSCTIRLVFIFWCFYFQISGSEFFEKGAVFSRVDLLLLFSSFP